MKQAQSSYSINSSTEDKCCCYLAQLSSMLIHFSSISVNVPEIIISEIKSTHNIVTSLNLVQALVTAVKSIILELETFYKPSSQKRNISKL